MYRQNHARAHHATVPVRYGVFSTTIGERDPGACASLRRESRVGQLDGLLSGLVTHSQERPAAP